MRSADPRPLSGALRDFARAALGPVAEVEELSWDHGESSVWRVRGRGGAAILKVHRQGGRKFEQELTAYRDWLPRLAPTLEEGTGVPELLAVRTAVPRALLLSHEAGELADGPSSAGRREADAHRRAGAFLRSLHALEVEASDPLPLGHAYAKRITNWSRRARSSVPSATLADMRAMASEATAFVERHGRVPCHRDFTPRNWLVDRGASRLVIIDFEHARSDLYLEDLLRLFVGEWRRAPKLAEPFLEGYGRQLTEDEEEALARLGALWSLATIHWAKEHGDAAFEALGWSTWEWLRQGGGLPKR